jgi:hypothetical protein
MGKEGKYQQTQENSVLVADWWDVCFAFGNILIASLMINLKISAATGNSAETSMFTDSSSRLSPAKSHPDSALSWEILFSIGKFSHSPMPPRSSN